MQKQAASVGRLLAMAGFALSCFGLLLFLWLTFGGAIPLQPKGYRLHVDFPEAAALAKEADVRISGVPVGKVRDLQLGPGNTTDATLELDAKYAPLPRDSRAILRQKTLLGETYVELTPGTKGEGNALPEGGTLARSQVSDTVQLDEIFRSFDARTRQAFQTWMQSQALAFEGRGADLNAALGNLAPFTENANQLLTILNSQGRAVRRVVRDTGTVVGALSARDGDLSSLITSSERVFRTTARRNSELQQAFTALPTFERESRTTVDRLTSFARQTDPLVNQLRPAAHELSPTLRDLGSLAPDLRGLFVDLDPLIAASRRGLPALRALLVDLRPAIGQLDPALRNLNPALDYLGMFRGELGAFFANVPSSTEAVAPANDGRPDVHYLRQTSPASPEALSASPVRYASTRPNAYPLPDAFRRIARGLQVYENRQCGRPGLRPVTGLPGFGPRGATPVPGLPIATPKPLTAANVTKYAVGLISGIVPAPPCSKQPKFPAPFNTDYPRLEPAPNRR